jgi:hypothetical protein
MIRYYGEQNVPGAPGQIPPTAVRFDPTQLFQQPLPGYNMRPGYDPSSVDIERDRFILHNPKSGVAGGNFMGGEGLQINPEAHKQQNRQQKIYNKGMGTDNPNEKEIFLRRSGPQLPMAMGGMQPMGNAGMFVDNAQMFMGPQFGQVPAGFQNKIVS